MSKQQLLLPAPYGYNDGYHISLHADPDVLNPAKTIDAVMSFGCPRRIAEKAVSCLENSGRYDCVMSPSAWYDGRARGLESKLDDAGVGLELRSGPRYNDPGRDARHDRQAEQRAYHFREGGHRNGYNYDNLPRRVRTNPIDFATSGLSMDELIRAFRYVK